MANTIILFIRKSWDTELGSWDSQYGVCKQPTVKQPTTMERAAPEIRSELVWVYNMSLKIVSLTFCEHRRLFYCA